MEEREGGRKGERERESKHMHTEKIMKIMHSSGTFWKWKEAKI